MNDIEEAKQIRQRITVSNKSSVANMHGIEKIKMIRQYCDYLERHLNDVKRAWEIIQKACTHEKFISDDYDFWTTHYMIEHHDMSKFSKDEFVQYAEWFFGKYGKNYDFWDDGSAGVETNEVNRNQMDSAWKHHTDNNAHHWQHWTKLPDGDNQCLHIICMIADWMAMSMELGDSAEDYYKNNKHEMNLPEWADSYIMRIFSEIKEVAE